MATTKDWPTHYYRWVFRLIGAYLIGFAAVAVLLLVSITGANAGLPALFFGGALAATAVPAFGIGAVLAGLSLAKREPYRPAMLGIVIVSCLIIWAFHGTFLAYGQLMAKIATEPGFLGQVRPKASAAVLAPNAAISEDDTETIRGAHLDRAQSELTRRGYRLVHSDGSGGVQHWWNRKDGQCMRVHVQDSVVDAADMLPTAECARALERPQPDRGY